MFNPGIKEASKAFSYGRKILLNPFSLAIIAIGKTPLIVLNLPSNDNSPINNVLLDMSSEIEICLEVNKSPKAIGKSKAGPSFLISAGAKLIVVLLEGVETPEFFNAARTLSFDSSTALSGSSTILK